MRIKFVVPSIFAVKIPNLSDNSESIETVRGKKKCLRYLMKYFTCSQIGSTNDRTLSRLDFYIPEKHFRGILSCVVGYTRNFATVDSHKGKLGP
jgi:hypothetical protein